MFKNLKAGSIIYIFDRVNVVFTQETVTNVTPPHYDNHYSNPMDMVVDVSIDGHKNPYTLKDSADVGYTRNDTVIITTDINKALREVEAVKAQSEQILSKKDVYESNVQKCSDILSEYSPSFKEKRDNEERFSNLENSVGELKDMIKGLVKELKG